MRTLSRLFILAVILVFFVGGCAALKVAFQTEPEKVEMVLLTELRFMGEVAGVKSPVIFGDFSVTHHINVLFAQNKFLLEWIPISEENRMIFMMWVKVECPEAIALYTYDLDTEKSTFWIYDIEGQAWQVDEEKYDAFLELSHPCVGEKPVKKQPVSI